MGSVVIGLDPGPHTGIAVLDLRVTAWPSAPVLTQHLASECLFLETEPSSVPGLLTLLCRGLDVPQEGLVIATEDWALGPASLKAGAAGKATRELIAEVQAWAGGMRPPEPAVVLRRAADVKPWATDRRLGAAWLLDRTKGMGHARDATRHALFHAVRSGMVEDPMRVKLRSAPVPD